MTRAQTAALLLITTSACGRDVTTIGVADAPVDARAPDATEDAGDADAGGTRAPAPPGTYLEAEDGQLSGFTIENEPEASGGRALLAPDVLADSAPGAARARYAFELTEAGEYVVWGRVYAPDVVANRFWIQLDGGAFVLWRISTGEVWYWDDVHDDTRYALPHVFTFAAGAHELVVANAGPGARLDRLYITAAGDEPPGNDTPCDPPHTIEVGGTCLPSCGLLMGTACGPACASLPPLPAYDCDVCCQVE